MKVISSLLLCFLLVSVSVLAADEAQKPAAKPQEAKPQMAAPAKSGEAPNMTPVEIKNIEATVVFMKKVTGSYQQTAKVIEDVLGKAKELGLQVMGTPFGVYYNDPGKVKEEELSWSVSVPVKEKNDKQLPPGYEYKGMDATTAAFSVVTGPYEEMGKFYGAMFAWIGKNGYIPTGSTMEKWLNDPSKVEKDKIQTEIIIPVKKMINESADKPKTEEKKEEKTDKPKGM